MMTLFPSQNIAQVALMLCILRKNRTCW